MPSAGAVVVIPGLHGDQAADGASGAGMVLAKPGDQHAQVALAFPQHAHWQSPADLLQQVQEPPALHAQAALAFPKQAQPQSLLDFPQQAQELADGFRSVMVVLLLER